MRYLRYVKKALNPMRYLRYVKKALVVVLLLLSHVVAFNVLPSQWQALAVAVLDLAATYGVYRAKNRPLVVG